MSNVGLLTPDLPVTMTYPDNEVVTSTYLPQMALATRTGTVEHPVRNPTHPRSPVAVVIASSQGEAISVRAGLMTARASLTEGLKGLQSISFPEV